MPTLQIVFVDNYDAAFAALKDRRVDGFLADELLLLSYAQKSEAPQDFGLVAGYELPRTAGFGVKKNEPRFLDFVNRTLLELEASGDAAKIFDAWFAPVKRPFKIQPDRVNERAKMKCRRLAQTARGGGNKKTRRRRCRRPACQHFATQKLP